MRPVVQKFLAVSLLAVGVLGYCAIRPAIQESEALPSGKEGRLLLGRFWLDRMPTKRGEDIDGWLFLHGGLGMNDKGSNYRFSVDIFEFERRGSAFDLTWLHDKKKQTVSFDVVECHDKPPFDLCLDLKDELRGNRRLWSFSDDDDMNAHIPWATDWRSADELRAKSAR